MPRTLTETVLDRPCVMSNCTNGTTLGLCLLMDDGDDGILVACDLHEVRLLTNALRIAKKRHHERGIACVYCRVSKAHCDSTRQETPPRKCCPDCDHRRGER